MATELIVNASLPETRIVLMENGEIQELLIERATGKGIVGNIYKGRVTRVLPGMQAAFVDIGLEKAAFLYVDDVFVHPEIWEDEENAGNAEGETSEYTPEGEAPSVTVAPAVAAPVAAAEASESEGLDDGDPDEDDFDGEEEDEEGDPVAMGAEEGGGGDRPEGTVAPEVSAAPGAQAGDQGREGRQGGRRRRGRRGGRNRRDRERGRGPSLSGHGAEQGEGGAEAPEHFHAQVADDGEVGSDRGSIEATEGHAESFSERPESTQGASEAATDRREAGAREGSTRPEFREQRGKDRRIRSKERSSRPARGNVNIQDLLKEGQEVIVQVAKDPIATKGARLTCHLSLPGRHLVCMPTIDHIGVSRRIDRDDERRKLREFVERNRPRNLGFIVRTATGGRSSAERRLKQDMEYLTRLWEEIREKAQTVTAPALVYEDLNSVLRAIRDWVNEEIDKIVVDSKYYYSDIQRFVAHFMPALRSRVELYEGDQPVFDAFGISTELARAMDRKVWLKSGGYLVIDQAEALVAIDVNTGRFVGKKNLEDTILKTNLEAVQEIAYQLRLRNCGGIIVLDLIDMEKEENKQRVYRALEEALKKDRARPSIQKISDLGLIEMTRKRTRDTIIRTLCESCPKCEGKGYIKSKQTIAYDVLREIEREGGVRDVSKILVQASPEVIDVLALEERDTVDTLERRYRKPIYLQAVPDQHVEQFEIILEKRNGGASEKRSHAAASEEERDSRSDRGRDRNDRNRDRNRDRDRGDRNRQQQGSRAPAPAVPQPLQPAQPRSAEGTPLYDEEDQLAQIRAQAAQSAGIPIGGADNEAASSGDQDSEDGTDPRPPGGGGGGRHRHQRRRGRRGGRRNHQRDQQRPEGGVTASSGGDSAPASGGGEGTGGGSAVPPALS